MLRYSRSILRLALICLVAAPTLAQTDPADLLRTLQEQLDAGHHAEALATARRCSEVVPGNPAIWYNLAGLEEYHGHRPQALAAMRQAVVLGFDDFRHADTDTDLGELRDDPGYLELRAAWTAGLVTRVRSRRVELEAGAWSNAIDLVDRRGGLDPPAATVRLRVTDAALEVVVETDDEPLGMIPPWRGGNGLLVSVTLPEADTIGEGRYGVEFGFGMTEGLPAGAVRFGSYWQRLAELTPKLRRDSTAGHLSLSFTVPWSICASLHPLVDAELILNVTMLRADGHAALIDDPASGSTDHPWRRGVPIHVNWSVAAGPAVQGLPADHVVREAAIRLQVAAVTDDRDATVRLVFRDHAGELSAPVTWSLPGGKPPRTTTDDLAVPLPTGSARLGASLATGGDGDPITWETDLVILPHGWESHTEARIAAAPPHEQPSLRYRLTAVSTVLAQRHPRQNPAALGTTVDELETMLARSEATGTSLPDDGGVYLAVIPADADHSRLKCSLSLPGGWRRGDPTRVLLLLARASGAEQRAAMMASRVLAERSQGMDPPAPPVVVAIPHLRSDHDPHRARHTTDRVIDWLREFLACGPVHLAGVDLLGATALETGAARPDDVAAALLITGMNFAPYPELESGELPPNLSTLSPTLPVGWIWFPEEHQTGDQTASLLDALRRHGLTVEPALAVSGGLGYSQAWSRAVLWAAGISP